MAVIFSNGSIAKAAKPSSIAGKFSAERKIWIFKFLEVNTANFVFKMYGVMIKNPKKKRKKPVVNTFNSSWASFIKVPIKVPKIMDIIIKKIANWLLFNK